MTARAHSDPPSTGIVTIPSADGWSLEHHGYDTAHERSEESVFSLTNGFLGLRASRDEGSAESTPALFMAGVYDEGPTGSEDLVIGPDITTARILIDGEALSGFRLVDHGRRLDLCAQTLDRRAVFESPHGLRVTLRSTWAASLARPHLATRALAVETSAAANVSVWVGATARRPHPLLPIGHDVGSATVAGTAVLSAGTSHGVRMEAAISATARLGTKPIPASACSDSSSAGFHITARVTPRRGLGLTMHAAVFSSKETGDPAAAAVRLSEEARRLGFDGVIREHRAAWAEAWQTADVEIDGDPEAQLGVRYAAMQMIAVCPPPGVDASIAAKGLSGPGYKGHVFWDNEVFLLPFYSLAKPRAARHLLHYRTRRLAAAEARAAAEGYAGAWYPWESADTGVETTPRTLPGPDGTPLPVWCGTREIHLGADVAWACAYHHRAAGDEQLLADAAPMILAIARFYTSRATKSDRGWEIRHVISPDELHEDVSNSAYQNMMAAETIRLALRLADRGLVAVSDLEHARLLAVADSLVIPRTPEGLIDESDGFSALPLPEPEHQPKPDEPLRQIKQADVLMLFAMHPETYDAATLRVHYALYEPLTRHLSSLSEAMHSLVARRAGLNRDADHYLHAATRIDLQDTHQNTDEGLHLATHGGIWQAVVIGCGGVYPADDALHLAPRLPAGWHRLSFPLCYRGSSLRVTIDHDVVTVSLTAGDPVPISIDGRLVLLGSETPVTLDRWRQAA
jgi:trehalose/maltose hydrolase-like predicted phosphorylase